ncbi:hypothetical protein JXA88_04390, partial [Candidatus Fermentibacteria bacterium]|nr:hypothetical protein [Candidatus Fermentibacteria bacterium]
MKSTIVVVLVALLATFAHAEIPQVISYQGKVTDAAGTPVADGAYTMRFRIYDAVSAGTLLWDSGAQPVSVTNGIFSVLLGESPQPALTLDFSADYWLLVTFGGVDQAPRQRLASIGYAYMASGLVAGTEVSGSVASGTMAALAGSNTATTGMAYGGVFESHSTSGRGVYGYVGATAGTTYGGYFVSCSSAGRGVHGAAISTTGTTYGGVFESGSPSGYGVYGYASSNSGFNFGVYGRSLSSAGCGMYGSATAPTGFTYGVYGKSHSTLGYGVYGYASATTGTTYGVYGRSDSTSGKGVYYEGGLAGSGSKSCVVKTSKGPTLMYCQESPENWFEDFGEGQLMNGRCHIELDPLFLETVTIDRANPMKVFLQPQDPECEGLAAVLSESAFDA